MSAYTDSALTRWLSRQMSATETEMRKGKMRNTEFERTMHDIAFARDEILSRVAGSQLHGKAHLMESIRSVAEAGPCFTGAFDQAKHADRFREAAKSLLKELEGQDFPEEA